MKHYEVSRACIVPALVVLFALGASCSWAAAQDDDIPPDVLAFPPAIYGIGKDGKMFDVDDEQKLTIEGWFYFTDTPTQADVWMFLYKAGSYQIELWGEEPVGFDISVWPPPKYEVYLRTELAWTREAMHIGDHLTPHQWVHIAYMHSAAEYAVYVGGQRMQSARMEPGFPSVPSAHPLYIGGCPWRESIQAFVDEIRVSTGFEYKDRAALIEPQHPLLLTEQTLALWRFEEGPEASSYMDSSGNGHTLSVEKVYAISPRNLATMTWAGLRTQP